MIENELFHTFRRSFLLVNILNDMHSLLITI